VLQALKLRARQLKREALTLYFAMRDPRTPWFARAVAAAVVAYAFSPIDLIPDFIPILGYLDDLIVVPLGVAVVIRLIPKAVLAECRQRAEAAAERPMSRAGAAFVIAVWLACAGWAFLLVRDLLAAR
jgi:uncharacterized membrane protein YkvA (DUF1232 family)